MTRRRTPRPAAQAQALIALAALPLVLTTSNVGVTQASAARTGDSGPAPTAASLDAITADDLPDLTGGDTLEAVPAAFQVPERPTLGTPRAGDIPWAALQAYQRAADILGEVQPSCGLSWTLLGAVGQVESDHGTVGGGELGADGIVSPELVSDALDGKGQRPAVEDTDGGEFDGDDTWDRAVGPMQLLPGVWSLVGVDGDGDGTRSPQDVDDAALAAAVYLCSVGTDLSDPDGVTEALAEYNGTAGYADQVLAVEKRYADRAFDVSGAPKTSSIGSTLDDGQGSPAQESERALREAEGQREERPALSARRGQQAAGRDASPSRPEAPAADDGPKSKDDAAAPKPRPSSPDDGSDDGAGDGSAQRPDADPTDEPSEPPTDEAIDPTAPVDDLEPGDGDEQHGDAVDENGDQAEEPDDAAEEPGDESEEPGDESAQPSHESEEPKAEPTDDADETAGDDPAEDTDEQPADEADTDGEADDQGEGDEQNGEQPAPVTVIGELTVCGEGFCLDGAALDLTAAGDLTAEAGTDLDGDGAVESVADELTGLEGRTVEVLVVEGTEPLLVVTVDGHVVVPH